ncbi:MAG TPA: methyltransferase domain-containing protein [Chitinivibrionales bacterium]|nr:methyltransferase domain-containing protein [Chitinivibrionales bacterium]
MARGRHPTRIRIAPPDEQTAAKYLRFWRGIDLHHEPQRFPGLTSPEMFGNGNPLEIDFGCGTGALLCERAQRFPNVNFIGIDKSQKPLFCAVRQAAAADAGNVTFIRGDFGAMLALLRRDTVSRAYYLFPNPPDDYDNKRANGRRRRFLEAAYNSLTAGGQFYFATDSERFFQNMKDIVKIDLKFQMVGLEFNEEEISSKYLHLWREKGRVVMGLTVEKK